MMKKYMQTDKWFKIPLFGVVQPFNHEEVDPPHVSWSHGFTHFRDRTGKIFLCGQNWFEENAVESLPL